MGFIQILELIFPILAIGVVWSVTDPSGAKERWGKLPVGMLIGMVISFFLINSSICFGAYCSSYTMALS
jgi:dolichyl-phosphate-mannose--protein O-mannosyl transferase